MADLTEAQWVPHVNQDGSRQHVTSWLFLEWWYGQGATLTLCSEPWCENNLFEARRAHRMGVDPTYMCFPAEIKEWLGTPAGRSALAKEERS